MSANILYRIFGKIARVFENFFLEGEWKFFENGLEPVGEGGCEVELVPCCGVEEAKLFRMETLCYEGWMWFSTVEGVP